MFNRNITKRHHINGGPACFGDSGGPLWRVVNDKITKKDVPVLIGVFSFTLWGTCHGAQVKLWKILSMEMDKYKRFSMENYHTNHYII